MLLAYGQNEDALIPQHIRFVYYKCVCLSKYELVTCDQIFKHNTKWVACL